MQFSTYCVECLVRRQVRLLHKQNDEEKAFACLKDMLQALREAPEGVAAPYVVSKCQEVFARYFEGGDLYARIKRESNESMLACVPRIRAEIAASPDPLLTALQYARVGNYIDFGALDGCVSSEELDRLLAGAASDPVDPAEYACFVRDLKRAKRLLYILDNAGEIVLDKLLMETLRAAYPDLEICACVRGAPVLNDATRADAEAAGLAEVARVIDNGTAISGTQIAYIGGELRQALGEANVILAKGQGNFETMWGCGLNVYYAFLCKCDWFTKLFRVPKLTAMFLNENRVKTYEITE